MAINEACQVWIEQRITEELALPDQARKSHRAIAKEIAQEINRIFETKVKEETIRKRIDRVSGTFVPSQATTEYDNEITNNKNNKTKKGTTRKRKMGGGRKPKYIMNERNNFIGAYEQLISAVEKLRINGWKSVTRQEAFEKIKNILILIED